MDRGGAIARFAYEIPSLDSYWRAIVIFGQNVASYKFALAGALLEIGTGSEVLSLDELALPFASRVAEHLRTHDKQGTFQQSRFLDACRAFNSGDLDADGLTPHCSLVAVNGRKMSALVVTMRMWGSGAAPRRVGESGADVCL